MPLVDGHLSVGLALDQGSKPRPVDQAMLERWSTSVDALLPKAIDNLRQRSSPESWYPLQAVPGMFVYLSGDGHAAARLLLLRELVDPWPLGGLVVTAPTPDQLLCVPMEGLDQLTAFQVLVQAGHVAQQLSNRALSDQVFWFDGTSWAHIPVVHGEDTVEVTPPPRFLRLLEQLTVLQMAGDSAEA